MDDLDQRMWLSAGKAKGKIRTCQNRQRFSSEEEALVIASHEQEAGRANSLPGQREWFTVTAYPCYHCEGWHTGLPLSPQSQARFIIESLGFAIDY